jgi:hypothetical protein
MQGERRIDGGPYPIPRHPAQYPRPQFTPMVAMPESMQDPKYKKAKK